MIYIERKSDINGLGKFGVHSRVLQVQTWQVPVGFQLVSTCPSFKHYSEFEKPPIEGDSDPRVVNLRVFEQVSHMGTCEYAYSWRSLNNVLCKADS
jgi:hypothetical protein